MTLNEFQSSIAPTYRPNHLACHALGIAGEAGEVADEVKKWLYHHTPANDLSTAAQEAHDYITRVREELGDLFWYLAAVASDHQLSLNDIAQGNIEKLAKRYPRGFVKNGGIREPEEIAEAAITIEAPEAIRARLRNHPWNVNPMSEKD